MVALVCHEGAKGHSLQEAPLEQIPSASTRVF